MDRANRQIRRYLAFSANSLSLLSASSASLRSGASRYAGETKQDDGGEMLERHVGLADKDGEEQANRLGLERLRTWRRLQLMTRP